MSAAKVAGYLAPYLVKEGIDMARPKVKKFFTAVRKFRNWFANF